MERVSQKKWLMDYFSEITQQQKHTITFKGNFGNKNQCEIKQNIV